MSKEKIELIRKWGTTVLSVFLTVFIPILLMWQKNNRLETERWVMDQFVLKAAYEVDKKFHEFSNEKTHNQLDAIKSQLDAILIQQALTQERVANLRDSQAPKSR